MIDPPQFAQSTLTVNAARFRLAEGSKWSRPIESNALDVRQHCPYLYSSCLNKRSFIFSCGFSQMKASCGCFTEYQSQILSSVSFTRFCMPLSQTELKFVDTLRENCSKRYIGIFSGLLAQSHFLEKYPACFEEASELQSKVPKN